MKDKLKEVYPIIFLTIVVLLSMTLLTLTDSVTKDIIKENEREKIMAMLSVQFSDMDSYEYDEQIEVYTIRNITNDTIGYAFMAVGKGYGGDIKILVGLNENETTIMDDETTIKAISIIFQIETPGLGNKITDTEFTTQFQYVDIEDVELTKDGGKIDAITGATISSSAVVDAVKETAMEKVALLREKEGS